MSQPASSSRTEVDVLAVMKGLFELDRGRGFMPVNFQAFPIEVAERDAEQGGVRGAGRVDPMRRSRANRGRGEPGARPAR